MKELFNRATFSYLSVSRQKRHADCNDQSCALHFGRSPPICSGSSLCISSQFFFWGGGGISSNVTTLSLEQILLHQCNDNFISFHDCSDGLVKKIEFHNNLAGYRNGRILYRKAIASFANFSRNNQLVRQRCSCECSRWRLSPVQFPRTVKLLLMSNR